MNNGKILLWSGISAVVVEGICFILFIGCPLFGPLAYVGIVLLYPAMFLWRLLLPVTPEALNVILLFVLPFMQFFFVILAILLFKRKKQN